MFTEPVGIRAPTPADYAAFVRLFGYLETGDDIPTPKVWRDELALQSMVYVDEGEAVGYVYAQVLEGVGFVRHVALEPSRRGCGLGRALMHAVAGRMREAGVEQWRLNVKPDNAQALRLYQGLGMTMLFASVAMVRALLEAMRPNADPRKTFMQLVVEDASALASALGRAGARRHLDTVQLGGPLPSAPM
ncbi:MAG: GNAT family N-acetyltransferase [Nannocystaceae bacterium]|nr:GNAT family N-acetyltransferase [Nannocystaceae bacterium]